MPDVCVFQSDMVNNSLFDYIGKSESASIHNMLYNYRISLGSGPELNTQGTILLYYIHTSTVLCI